MSNVITITARIIDAEKVKASIGAIGDVSTKTAKEIQAHSKAVVAAEKEIEAAFKTQAAEYRTQREALRTAQAQAAQSAREAAEAAKNSGRSFSEMAMGLGKTAGAFALAQLGIDGAQAAIGTLNAKVDESIKAFAEQESALKTLDTVTAAIGGRISDARGIVEKFNDSISSPAAVAQAVRNLSTMGLSTEETTKLIERIRDGAVGMGTDVNEALMMVSKAIKQGNSDVLDNIGVVTNVSVMYEEYAAKVGKTADSLSQMEKNQAIANGVLKETDKFAGMAAQSTETLQGKIQAHEKSSKDLAAAVGESLAPAYEKWLAALTGINKALQVAVNPEYGKSLQKKILEAQEAVVRAEEHARNAEKRAPGEGVFGAAGIAEAYQQLADARRKLLELQQEFDRQHKQNAAPKTSGEVDPDKAKEAAAEAKKSAAEQKRLAEDLQKDLATIGKTGRDLELAQLKLWYDEKVRLAHGNAKLLAQVEQDKARRLAEINRQAAEQSRREAQQKAERASNIDSQNASTMRRLGLTGDANTIWSKDNNKVAVDDFNAGWEAYDREREKKEKSDEKGAKKLEAAAEKGSEYLADAIGSALTSGGGVIANSIRTGQAPSAGDVTRSGAGMAGGVAGFLLGGPMGAALGQQIGQAAGDIIGSFFDRHDEEARQTAEIQRQAAEKQMQAAASAVENSQSAFDRAQDASLRLKVARGEMTEDQASIARQENDNRSSLDSLRSNLEKAGVSSTDFDLALSLIQSRNGGTMTKEQSLNLASTWIGANNAQAIARTLDGNADLLEALKAELANKDQDRAQPGSTPDRPIYSSIVNFKDMMAFFAPGELFRAQGPGTRRADGMKERAVNTRAV